MRIGISPCASAVREMTRKAHTTNDNLISLIWGASCPRAIEVAARRFCSGKHEVSTRSARSGNLRGLHENKAIDRANRCTAYMRCVALAQKRVRSLLPLPPSAELRQLWQYHD